MTRSQQGVDNAVNSGTITVSGSHSKSRKSVINASIQLSNKKMSTSPTILVSTGEEIKEANAEEENKVEEESAEA